MKYAAIIELLPNVTIEEPIAFAYACGHPGECLLLPWIAVHFAQHVKCEACRQAESERSHVVRWKPRKPPEGPFLFP